MVSSGEKKNAYRRGKKEVMNMELYDDYSILAELGWQAAEQPWSSSTVLQYVKLAFSDRMWPRKCHAKNVETKSASWYDLVDIEVKWRFVMILRALSNSDRYARNMILVSIVSLMYAGHVLRVVVDWSTLPSTGFGHLSEMYLKRKPTQIAYVAILDWFRINSALVDVPEFLILANRELWSRSRPRKRRRLSVDNELDRDLGAIFAQMEMTGAGQAMTGANGELIEVDGELTGADGELTGVAGVLTGEDKVLSGPDGVLTGADGVMVGPDRVEIRGVHNISAEEQSKFLADIAAYKARISFLESKLVELGFTEDASNDDSVIWAEELFEDGSVEQPENQAEDQVPMPTAPVFPPNEANRKLKCQMTDLELWRFEERLDPQTTVQEQLDSALDWMNLADHFATALAFENQALANKVDEL
jgi:hypothetical protein